MTPLVLNDTDSTLLKVTKLSTTCCLLHWPLLGRALLNVILQWTKTAAPKNEVSSILWLSSKGLSTIDVRHGWLIMQSLSKQFWKNSIVRWQCPTWAAQTFCVGSVGPRPFSLSLHSPLLHTFSFPFFQSLLDSLVSEHAHCLFWQSVGLAPPTSTQ